MKHSERGARGARGARDARDARGVRGPSPPVLYTDNRRGYHHVYWRCLLYH